MQPEQLEEYQKEYIDLHGLTAEEAELVLIELLEALDKEVRAVQVTHGYSHGTTLKRMVRNDFYHWRVKDKRVGLNAGVTWLLLK